MSDNNFNENKSLPGENEPMDHKTAMNILAEHRLEKGREFDELREAEKRTRTMEKKREEDKHNEHMQWLKQNNDILQKLLEDSNNAIEQRNAIIRFMVESLVASNEPKETKLKKLLEFSVQFATLTGGASDVMQIINESMEKLS